MNNSEQKYVGSDYSQTTAMPKIKTTTMMTYIILVLVILGIYNFVDFNLPAMPTMVDRVVFMTRWHFLTVLTFLHMLQFVLYKRGTVAWNPMNPTTAHLVEVENRVLTNSVEQLILFVGTTTILTTYLEESRMALIPILIITWCFGRLLFGYGYIYHPIYRVPGFGINYGIIVNLSAALFYYTFSTQSMFMTIPAFGFLIFHIFAEFQFLFS
ncbi:uncharacterized protein LOC131876813 [Tigriopus californicus]|uniref:uncharacterized protein LOC131876813 n=1 Tax=Tigriopus californicus TaxID=6832 RepID=UPI0027D9D48B|nr:uncharacterized protein LOC131876813 [Tigriopus californicus]|eukprot:TCALIF_04532-PA protein Name:"Protein of unknown function" AED:0.13 eAED:0.13 QI:49/0.66/0.5/0.75/0.66/0.5/4/0/211